MDLLIHFPSATMKRNLAVAKNHEVTKQRMATALGKDGDADDVKRVVRKIETLRKNLVPFGYTGKALRSVPVENGQAARGAPQCRCGLPPHVRPDRTGRASLATSSASFLADRADHSRRVDAPAVAYDPGRGREVARPDLPLLVDAEH